MEYTISLINAQLIVMYFLTGTFSIIGVFRQYSIEYIIPLLILLSMIAVGIYLINNGMHKRDSP